MGGLHHPCCSPGAYRRSCLCRNDSPLNCAFGLTAARQVLLPDPLDLLIEPVPQNRLPKRPGGQTCQIRLIRLQAPQQKMQGSRSCADAATFVVPTAQFRMPGQEPCQL